MSLTNRQKRFIEEYLIDLNGTQAAIRAGYSPNGAEVTACELLKNPKVRYEVARAMAERSRRTGITQDRVLRELAKVAFFNAADVVDLETGNVKKDIDREDSAVIAGIKVKTIPTENGKIIEREVKLYDKLRALELLGKHLGMLDDRVKVDMNVDLTEVLKKAWEHAKKENTKETKAEN